MDRFTVIIKRNASYEQGMYGLSIHDEPGGAGNVEPINSEAQLREKLLGFGLNEDRVKGVIDRLKDKDDWVKLDVDPPRILQWEKTDRGITYTCGHCSWSIPMPQEDYAKAKQEHDKHVCAGRMV